MVTKYLFFNFLNKKYFFQIIKKIFKRFEPDNYSEAKLWAKLNTKKSTEELCKHIDTKLYDEIKSEINLIKKEIDKKFLDINFNIFGGAGNYILLYFLIRKFKLVNIVETGVAAGWTSLFILRALKKNNNGYLYSSDFPYFRLKNPEEHIGLLAKKESNKCNWFLDIRGDDIALPEIVTQLKNNTIDLLHYDSDKSYSGRRKALEVLNSKINSKTIIIFDDIQANLHFKDYIEKNNKSFISIEFNEKFLGVIGLDQYIKI